MKSFFLFFLLSILGSVQASLGPPENDVISYQPSENLPPSLELDMTIHTDESCPLLCRSIDNNYFIFTIELTNDLPNTLYCALLWSLEITGNNSCPSPFIGNMVESYITNSKT